MRDPARIPIVLEALRVAWTKYPDQRLLQLLVNATDTRPNPLFHVEDDRLLELLKQDKT